MFEKMTSIITRLATAIVGMAFLTIVVSIALPAAALACVGIIIGAAVAFLIVVFHPDTEYKFTIGERDDHE